MVGAHVGKAHPILVLGLGAEELALISAAQPALISMPIVRVLPRLEHIRAFVIKDRNRLSFT
jgi:hypothetical protein